MLVTLDTVAAMVANLYKTRRHLTDDGKPKAHTI